MKLSFFEVKKEELCNLYDVSPEEEKITMEDAIDYCHAYRILYKKSVKGFYISKKTLLEILTQNPDIDGVRLYEGIKLDGDVPVNTACITATVKGNVEGTHDDYLVPEIGNPLPLILPIIGEARPCPIHCGKDNQLNS